MQDTQQINLVIIADYGTGDPAFNEVLLRIRSVLPNAYIIPQATPPFSTLNTGFWIYQLSMATIPNTYIFSNTAPRKDKKEAQQNNRGEKLMYAQLENGFEIIAVNSQYVFSFVKPFIKKFAYVNVKNEGSQFRSRDNYPQAIAQMVHKDASLLEAEESVDIIPDVPVHAIASIDGYGNIKTTTRFSQVSFQPGQKLKITIGDTSSTVVFSDGIFNVPEGTFVFAPGSSGYNDRFMEISLRGSSASQSMGSPKVESVFSIEPLKE